MCANCEERRNTNARLCLPPTEALVYHGGHGFHHCLTQVSQPLSTCQSGHTQSTQLEQGNLSMTLFSTAMVVEIETSSHVLTSGVPL